MTDPVKDAILRDVRKALESARTKLVGAGLMIANGFGKQDARAEALRREWVQLGALLDQMKAQ